MMQLIERVRSYWVRFDKYEIRKDAKGTKYVTATADARPDIFDPLEDAQTMVLEALNVGRLYFGDKAPEGVAAFGGIAPTYRIALLDKPTIVWDFHSLLIGLQMMFSFMLAEDKTPLRMCDHCDIIFIAKRKNQYFCSDKCRRKGE